MLARLAFASKLASRGSDLQATKSRMRVSQCALLVAAVSLASVSAAVMPAALSAHVYSKREQASPTPTCRAIVAAAAPRMPLRSSLGELCDDKELEAFFLGNGNPLSNSKCMLNSHERYVLS